VAAVAFIVIRPSRNQIASPAPGSRTRARGGYRRIEWIEKALEPLRDQLDPPRFERLVHALAMVIGWESLIVQRDICGLDAAEGEELSVWAARALLDASLREQA
jgi:hypothetical protein